MHTEVLSRSQLELLPYLKLFKRSFYLAGGTAVAFHIGHRRSIEFDLFAKSQLNRARVKLRLFNLPFEKKIIFEDVDQLHMLINNVKITFFSFPYSINHPFKFNSPFPVPTLLTLAAMKAFALERRAKWKDYVDIYFILRSYYYSIDDIVAEAGKIFGQQFSGKLFRQQLAFHKDIDYSEPVEYIVKPVPDEEIKTFLIDKATDILRNLPGGSIK